MGQEQLVFGKPTLAKYWGAGSGLPPEASDSALHDLVAPVWNAKQEKKDPLTFLPFVL